MHSPEAKAEAQWFSHSQPQPCPAKHPAYRTPHTVHKKLKGPPRKEGPAQQEVLTEAAFCVPGRTSLHRRSYSIRVYASRHLRLQNANVFEIGVFTERLCSYGAKHFKTLAVPTSVDSHYVYGVSCRVRAKSYPSRPCGHHSPLSYGSPVSELPQRSTIGFAATKIILPRNAQSSNH